MDIYSTYTNIFTAPNPTQTLANIRVSEMLSILKDIVEPCPKCHQPTLQYYCIDTKCKDQKLICPSCENKSVTNEHFGHNSTFIMPLLMKTMFKVNEEKRNQLSKLKNVVSENIKQFTLIVGRYKAIEKCLEEYQLKSINLEFGFQEYIEQLKIFFGRNNQEFRKTKLSSFYRNYDLSIHEELNNCYKRVFQGLKQQLINLPKITDLTVALKEQLKGFVDKNKKNKNNKGEYPYCSTNIRYKFKDLNQQGLDYSNEYIFNNFKEYKITFTTPTSISSIKDRDVYTSVIERFDQIKDLQIITNSIDHLIAPIRFKQLEKFTFILCYDALHFQDSPQNAILINNIRIKSQNLKELFLRGLKFQDFFLLKNLLKNSNKKLHTLEITINEPSKNSLIQCAEPFLQFLNLVNSQNLLSFCFIVSNEDNKKYLMKQQIYNYLIDFINKNHNWHKLSFDLGPWTFQNEKKSKNKKVPKANLIQLDQMNCLYNYSIAENLVIQTPLQKMMILKRRKLISILARQCKQNIFSDFKNRQFLMRTCIERVVL